MKIYIIEDENNIPSELLNAENIKVFTAIGWVELDKPEFRCGVEYKITKRGAE
jgi:hypothetical protein